MPLEPHLTIYHRNRLFRECLRSALSIIAEFEVSEADHESADYLDLLLDRGPSVVLVDLSLPDRRAIEITQFTRDKLPQARIISLVPAHAQERVVDSIAAGSHGCVLEEASMQELEAAIERVVAGESFCSPRIVESMFNQLAQLGQQEASRNDDSSNVDLTPRELEVLELVAQDNTNKQIAERLSVSIYTVKNHVHNILNKLDVENRNQAVDHARQRQWFSRA